MTNFRLAVVASVMAACLAAGIGAASASTEGQRASAAAAKPELTVGAVGSTITTNLTFAADFLDLAYEPLIAAVPNAAAKAIYGPGLATKWRFIGGGNKNFELTLRHNVRFSTGEPVTAQAVVKWLDYWVKNNKSASNALSPFKARAIGRWTVRLTFESPSPDVVQVLSGYVHSTQAGLVAAPSCIADTTTLTGRTCGAGEYMLDPSQTVTSDHYTFIPNPYYYAKSKVHFSKVTVKVIADNASGLQALEAGQIQVLDSGPDSSTAAAAKAAGYRVTAFGGTAGAFLFFTLDQGGVQSKPLGDVRVRQALNYAIDRKAIAAAIGGEYTEPTSEIPTTDGWDPKLANMYAYNPAKAKSLLAAAGYPNGFTIETTNILNLQPYLNMAQAAAKYWSAVGVNLNLQTYPAGTWFSNLTKNPAPLQVCGVTTDNSASHFWNGIASPGKIANNVGGGFVDRQLYKFFITAARGYNSKLGWGPFISRYTTQAYMVPMAVQKSVVIMDKSIHGLAEPLFANLTDLYITK